VQREYRKTALLLALVPLAAAASAVRAAPEVAASPDAAARRFVTSCAGCHTVGGGKLTGPDLVGVTSWPVADLKGAIQRMQKYVGPLAEADLQQLADLLRGPEVRARLKSEEARVAQAFAAKMEPPSAASGKALFLGTKPLKNGGAPCLACHQAEGPGGTLGPDLGGIRARMGEVALASAIEKSAFKVMEPAYRRHPVDRQESLDLARYLASLDPAVVRTADAPLLLWGGLGAAALMAGLAVFQRNHSAPHPARLQRRRK
jgi:mono/diheme cytochrome c family protein